MKYEIAYYSRSGNTAMLAEEIAELLSSEDVRLTDLNCSDASDDADMYIIGFGINRGAVPMKVMDVLEQAEGKEIVLFVTCGMEPSEKYRISVERRVKPFLPDDCVYHGLFLCAGRFPDEVIAGVEATLERQPDNQQAQSVLANHEKTRNHPDKADIQNIRDFIWQVTLGEFS